MSDGQEKSLGQETGKGGFEAVKMAELFEEIGEEDNFGYRSNPDLGDIIRMESW